MDFVFNMAIVVKRRKKNNTVETQLLLKGMTSLTLYIEFRKPNRKKKESLVYSSNF
jgi:hypothetical protein